jgi:hypothetical protein
MPGRPPKSIQQHKQEGTYQKCRHENRGTSLAPIEGALECPKTVIGKKAKESWKRVVGSLCAARLVSAADFESLEDAFRCLDCANQLMDKIDELGGPAKYLADFQGGKDLLFEWRRCMDSYEKIMWKFGVTPVESAKIRGAKKDDDDETNAIKALIGQG